ncbi:hypothetical protein VTI74DRAFT_6389 [Chaetomium olivicolor]
MDKKHFASLMEDHSPRPSTSALRPLSPFRTGRRSMTRSGDGSTGTTPSHPGLDLDLNQDQPVLSCVTKETSQEDCARHRFIVWAAVKRNSSVRMTPEERLECPLLRCTQRFHDHESMLKHLAGCKHLASGEYWCYDHMRVERFDDLKCKKCLGHPSKRRKMLYLAKNFFHSLGHKSKKTQDVCPDDDEAMLAPPPSYDSLNIPTLNASASELPSTEILEIDSMEVSLLQPAPAPAPSDAIDPQALLMPTVPPLPELDSTMLSADFMQWQPIAGFTPVMQQEDISIRASVVKPTLQLTTAGLQGRRQVPRPVSRAAPAVPRSKGLSPSSSVRSTASTDTTVSTCSNGSSMISPSSNWSGAWSMASGLNTGMTSPVDGVDVDDMFAEAMNSYNNTYGGNETCPDDLHNFFSELPADFPMLQDTGAMPSDGLALFESSPANPQYAPNIVLTDEAARTVEINEPEVEEANVCCSETKSLVSSAWDALHQHIESSMEKIQDHRENRIASQFGTMSTQIVATTGLQTLRRLLAGQQPSSAGDALCLIHLVYAFSLVLDEQVSPDRVSSLFLQSLSYANALPPSDRNLYRQLVRNIWQPPDLTQANINNHLVAISGRSSGFSSDPKGKAPAGLGGHGHGVDSLLNTARDFLDALEISLVLGQGPLPLGVQVSDLHITHLKDMSAAVSVNGALTTTARYVLEMLAQGFGEAGLHSRLKGIYHRLGNGCISSVRRIELEILHAGRSCLPSARFFGSYVPSARKLCDQIYEEHDVGPSRRDDYHGLGVALIENLVSELYTPASKPAAPSLGDIDLDTYFDDLVPEAGNPVTAVTALQPSFDFGTMQAQLPTPTATSSGTPSSSHTTSPGGELPQQPPNDSPEQQEPAQKVEADLGCHLCDYRPKGDPQWFKGSMAKHMKTKHSGEPDRIYKCPFPGCTSQYKNRADNLRQHQIEKNHWAPGEEGPPRRPSKRKKVSDGE